MLDTLWQDVKYPARSLVRRPLVTTVAVLSLALGIGVNTAIFSVFERLVLRELPVPAPGELVNFVSPGPKPGSRSTGAAGGRDYIFSYPLFRDLERLEATGLPRVAAFRQFDVSLSHDGQTARGDGLLVSGGYFPALGVTPALGRLFTPDDDRTPGAHPVVVLAHGYWTTRFGADPAVIGRALLVNGQPLTIVGVAGAGFAGTTLRGVPNIFVPLAMGPSMAGLSLERDNHSLYLFARLERVTGDQLEARINGPFAAIIRNVEYPVLRGEMGERTQQEFLARRIALEDGSRGASGGRGEVRLMFGLLLAVTGLVLLIACANVANLLLARAAERSTEIAVRVSLGAGTGRLMRLLLAESALLGLLGAAGGLAVAGGTAIMLLRIVPAEVGRLLVFELNAPVLLCAMGLGLGTAVLFGLFPALFGVRSGLTAGAPSGRVTASRGAARFRTALATAQIAVATVLLAQSGLFIISLINVGRQELGIRRDGLIGFRVSPFLNGYTPESAAALFDQIENGLKELPGVTSVTATTVPPLSDASQGQNVSVEGFAAPPDADVQAQFGRTGADYFRTLGIPLLAGREFSRSDAAGAAKVAIVNEAFARKFKLGAKPVGKRIALGAGNNAALDIEIVGLVGDAKYRNLRDAPPPQFFLPYRQGGVGSLTFYAQASGDARQLRAAIPALVARVDPNLPIERLQTMDEQIWDAGTPNRLLATLSTSFAALATLLASIGLYAVLAYTVAQRLREFGIRLALGARRADVRWIVFAQVARMALIGGTIGLGVSLGLSRIAQRVLFGVQGDNPALVATVGISVAVLTFGVAALPARRASRVSPTLALRAE
jgi:putative ABC transport system permease protein